MDWLEVIRNLFPRQRAVEHNPETPRYSRARSKLRYVLERGFYLGERQNPLHENSVEIAVWAPPGHGRGSGYYCCFRIFLEDNEVTFTVLFCFYDGTEGAPGFKSIDSARVFAVSNGFNGESCENPH